MSHPTEKTKGLCLKCHPADRRELLLLELERPLTDCCSTIFAARLGFFTPIKGCDESHPPTSIGALNYLIANRFQHLFTPPTCHSELYTPSFGVNTVATPAASEFVNKPSGETITLLARRNKPWSLY